MARLSRATNAPQVIRMGNYIEQLRKELGLSLRYVARECKLSPGHLSKIEDGKLCAGIEVIVRISKFYAIPVATILRESGFVPPAEEELPPLAQYLRQRYGYSPQALRDMQLAKELCDQKYHPASAASIPRKEKEDEKPLGALKLPFLKA